MSFLPHYAPSQIDKNYWQWPDLLIVKWWELILLFQSYELSLPATNAAMDFKSIAERGTNQAVNGKWHFRGTSRRNYHKDDARRFSKRSRVGGGVASCWKCNWASEFREGYFACTQEMGPAYLFISCVLINWFLPFSAKISGFKQDWPCALLEHHALLWDHFHVLLAVAVPHSF